MIDIIVLLVRPLRYNRFHLYRILAKSAKFKKKTMRTHEFNKSKYG